jgi:DNA-binding MurR/RpiR family transcriptional regulator
MVTLSEGLRENAEEDLMMEGRTLVTQAKWRDQQRRSVRRGRRLVPPTKPGVRLIPWIGGLLPNLKRAQRRVAELVVEDPEQFINQPIAELAKTAGVSSGAIVQFCKSLHLTGLRALKIALARELAGPVLGEQGKPERTRHTMDRVIDENIRSLEQTRQLNNASAVDAAAAAMLHAKKIVLFSIGLSYPVAYSFYARLRFIGMPAFIEYDSHMQLAAAAEMREGEVAIGISLSGSTRETVECLQLSRSRYAQTISITNGVASPLVRAADFKLFAAPGQVKYFQAPLASRVSQMAIVDVLLSILGRHRREKALRHLQRAEEHLLKRRIV